MRLVVMPSLTGSSPRLDAQSMARSGSPLIAAVLVCAALTGCVNVTPEPLPTSSISATPSATTTPSVAPEPTSAGTPTPPPLNPPPQQVLGLSAETGGGSGEVLLRWTQNPEPDVVSYIVLRALSPGGSLTQIGTVSREAVIQFDYAPFVDSEATVGYYRVRAVNSAGGEGPTSAEVCGAAPTHSC
jgi:hypothetical protein